jgi:hypothetical protein
LGFSNSPNFSPGRDLEENKSKLDGLTLSAPGKKISGGGGSGGIFRFFFFRFCFVALVKRLSVRELKKREKKCFPPYRLPIFFIAFLGVSR